MEVRCQDSENPVYQPSGHLPHFRSKYVHFYYFQNDKPKIRYYYIEKKTPITPAQIEQFMRDLVAKIKGPNPPKPTAEGPPVSSVWKQKNYFAVVMDDEHDRLIECDAVDFQFKPETHELGNHSFRDGTDVGIITENVSGFFCLNLSKKAGGGDLSSTDYECFKAYVRHGHSHEGRDIRLNHELSGTNTGPP